MLKKIILSVLLSFILIRPLSAQQPSKMVLIEEGTGTWCAWCPMGKVFGSQLLHDYPDEVIFIEVHRLDPMVNEAYDNNSMFYIFPSGHINRKTRDLQVTHWQGSVITELDKTPPANINVQTTYDTLSRSLAVNISSKFFEDLTGDYRLAAIVVENAVTGNDDKYSQKNVFADNAQGTMGGYETLPSTIPYYHMVYDHVGRHLLGGYHGVYGSLPTQMIAGSTYNYTFNWTLPTDYNEEYIWLAALLINNENGEIINAGKSIYITGNKNASPFFLSTPNTLGYRDHDYTYNIRYHDAELDFCDIEVIEPLPSWLSFKKNRDGFATLEGIPSNLGTYDVHLRVKDADYTVDQSFQILVKDTTIVPTLVPRVFNDFIIIPNPNQGTFNLEFDKGIRYQVFDELGRMVANDLLIRDINDRRYSQIIDLKGLSNGIYFLKVFDKEGFVKTKKLLIANP